MTIGRTIPIALAVDLIRNATTTCRVLLITPVGVAQFGITSLDRDVVFDGVTCRARRGYTPSSQVGSADLSVENSEAEALLAEYPLDGVTAEMVNRGVLDDARFVEYLINYLAPEKGGVIIGSGTLGELRIDKGLRVYLERRSLTQTLKQKGIIELGSVNCQAKHGDERCKFPVDTLWDSGTVGTVGAETNRTFSFSLSSGMGDESGFYVPGLVYWTDGENAGRTYEVESFEVDSSGLASVTFAFPTEADIAANDHFNIRPDCTKEWGVPGQLNTCLYYNNRPNFRGQPKRPVADSAALSVPGGSKGGASGTGTTQPVSPE
jgi:uncharacterized phage protein (TIGR02218 family)